MADMSNRRSVSSLRIRSLQRVGMATDTPASMTKRVWLTANFLASNRTEVSPAVTQSMVQLVFNVVVIGPGCHGGLGARFCVLTSILRAFKMGTTWKMASLSPSYSSPPSIAIHRIAQTYNGNTSQNGQTIFLFKRVLWVLLTRRCFAACSFIHSSFSQTHPSLRLALPVMCLRTTNRLRRRGQIAWANVQSRLARGSLIAVIQLLQRLAASPWQRDILDGMCLHGRIDRNVSW